MDPSNQNKISPKLILAVGGILLVLIIVSSLLTLSKKKSSPKTSVQQKEEQEKIQKMLDLTPSPTFVPPSNVIYSTVDSVNFMPQQINDYVIDATKLEKTAKQAYQNLSGTLLLEQINKDIFTWLALNDFYSSVDPSKVSTAYSIKKIENLSSISKENASMLKVYNTSVLKLDGYYLKLRYKGTLPSNLSKLKKTEADLQPLAQQLMSKFRDDALKNPKTVLSNFNKNNTVILMNNRETSKSFTNSTSYPPLVATEDYAALIQSLPVGRVSDIITLRSKLRGKALSEDYAYVVFNITKKSGSYIPVEALVNSYVSKAEIR